MANITFTQLDPAVLDGYPGKISFLVENRVLLEQRSILLQLFTRTVHRSFEIPNTVVGSDLIEVSANEAFDLLDYLETPIFAVPKTAPVEISFPEAEHQTLQGQDRIVTTRILNERNKYHMGQRVRTPWGEVYTVSRLKRCRRIIDHPHYAELTQAWKDEIGINRFTVYTLDKVSPEKALLVDEDYCLYGVLSASINRQELPITDVRGRMPAKAVLVKLSDNGAEAPYQFLDTFGLGLEMIENYTSAEVIKTTVGRYLMNYLILVKPFGKKIPYINDVFSPGKLDDLVAKGLLAKQFTRKEYDAYMDYGYFIGQFTELGVACLSMKALMTDPKAHEVRERLLRENKDKLDDPVVMTQIEAQLIEMDKAWLKDDPSAVFYHVTAKKSYTEQRKKLYLLIGAMSAFDSSANSFSTIPTSLSEGWRSQDIPLLANEARRGSYGRAKGTAKGGEATKYLLRVFQDTIITTHDCGSTDGLPVTLTEENYLTYMDRYCLEGTRLIKLTSEVIKQYLGKTVKLRSPQYCHPEKGFCFVCCGGWFESFDNPNIGMMSLDVGAVFTNQEMEAMHKSGVNSMTIDDLTPYFFSAP